MKKNYDRIIIDYIHNIEIIILPENTSIYEWIFYFFFISIIIYFTYVIMFESIIFIIFFLPIYLLLFYIFFVKYFLNLKICIETINFNKDFLLLSKKYLIFKFKKQFQTSSIQLFDIGEGIVPESSLSRMARKYIFYKSLIMIYKGKIIKISIGSFERSFSNYLLILNKIRGMK